MFFKAENPRSLKSSATLSLKDVSTFLSASVCTPSSILNPWDLNFLTFAVNFASPDWLWFVFFKSFPFVSCVGWRRFKKWVWFLTLLLNVKLTYCISVLELCYILYVYIVFLWYIYKFSLFLKKSYGFTVESLRQMWNDRTLMHGMSCTFTRFLNVFPTYWTVTAMISSLECLLHSWLAAKAIA